MGEDALRERVRLLAGMNAGALGQALWQVERLPGDWETACGHLPGGIGLYADAERKKAAETLRGGELAEAGDPRRGHLRIDGS